MYLMHQEVLSFGTWSRSQVETVPKAGGLGRIVPASKGADNNESREEVMGFSRGSETIPCILFYSSWGLLFVLEHIFEAKPRRSRISPSHVQPELVMVGTPGQCREGVSAGRCVCRRKEAQGHYI